MTPNEHMSGATMMAFWILIGLIIGVPTIVIWLLN